MKKRRTTPSLFPTLFTAIAVSLALVQPHAGFLVLLLIVMLPIWLFFSVAKRAVKPTPARNLLARTLIWLIAIAAIIGVHYNRAVIMRANASEVVATINDYSAKHGRCPDSLDDVGINEQRLQEMIGASGYMCANGKPTFFYVAPFIIQDRYIYDFAQGSWSYQASLLNRLSSV
jgi:hypothetical protein